MSGLCLPYRIRYRSLGVAGLPPLDLMAREKAEVFREGVIRQEGDFDQGPRRNRWSRMTVEEWQRRWNIADKGRWSLRIIPCVVEWTERRHGLVSIHLTQVLTGHGCFRSYLKKIRVYESAECPTCPEIDEDVEHALFVCPRFREERERFRALWEGPLNPEGIGRCLLSSQIGWDAVIDLATEVVDRLNSARTHANTFSRKRNFDSGSSEISEIIEISGSQNFTGTKLSL